MKRARGREKTHLDKYLDGKDVEQHRLTESLAGQITLTYEISPDTGGDFVLRVTSGKYQQECAWWGGFAEANFIAVKRFIEQLEPRLIITAMRLMEAANIYVSQTIRKSNPRDRRQRLLNAEIRDLNEFTAAPIKGGCPPGSEIFDREDFREKVEREIRNWPTAKPRRQDIAPLVNCGEGEPGADRLKKRLRPCGVDENWRYYVKRIRSKRE